MSALIGLAVVGMYAIVDWINAGSGESGGSGASSGSGASGGSGGFPGNLGPFPTGPPSSKHPEGSSNRTFPGKPWSPEEAMVVKAKLWQVFSWTQKPAHDALFELYGPGSKDGPLSETVGGTGRFGPTAIRLGFHGCLRDRSGNGGCDGCLYSAELDKPYMDYVGQHVVPNDFPGAPNFNNGLKPLVDILEEVYTNESFPEKSPFLNKSLFHSGKSRADLWAFAGAVATEFAIGQNNMVCHNPDWEWPCNYPDSLETNGFWSRHCTQKAGQEDCAINVVNHIKFKTGRTDCIPAQVYQLVDGSTCPENLDINKEWQCEAAGLEQGITVQFSKAVKGSDAKCISKGSPPVSDSISLCHRSVREKYDSAQGYYVVNPLHIDVYLEQCPSGYEVKDEAECIKASEYILLPFVKKDAWQVQLEYGGCFVFTEYVYGGKIRQVVEYQDGLPPPPPDTELRNRLRNVCRFPETKVQGYMDSKWGKEPGNGMDGEQTVQFFKEEFGLTPRESVALLGAHSVGRFHARSSLFRYIWVRNGGQTLNNEYYRNMANLPDYRFSDPDCAKIGDAKGNPPEGKWKLESRSEQKNLGPYAWFLFRKICLTDCRSLSEVERNNDENANCCQDLPDGDTCNPSCVEWNSEGGNHELMLPSEIGFYYKFHVNNTEHIPLFSGCPGMQNLENPDCYWYSGKDCEYEEVGCPLNDAPADKDLKMHEVVELYADNQDQWVKEFNEVFQKVMHNGYEWSKLDDAPDTTTDVVCPYQTTSIDPNLRYWVCINKTQLSEPFRISSELDGHFLQLDDITGAFETSASDSSATTPTNQMWYWAPLPGGGKQLVNGLMHFGAGNLYFNSSSRYLQNQIGMLSRAYSGDAVTYYDHFDDRSWTQNLYQWKIQNVDDVV